MSEERPMYVDGGASMAEIRTFLERVRQHIAGPDNFDRAVEHLRSVVHNVDELSNILTRIRNQPSLPPDLAAQVDRILQRVRP